MFYSSVTLNVRLPDFDIHAINTSVITLATVQTLATLHGSFDTSLTVITTLAAMFTIWTHDSEGTQRDSQLIRLDRPRNEHMPPSTTQQLRNSSTPQRTHTIRRNNSFHALSELFRAFFAFRDRYTSFTAHVINRALSRFHARKSITAHRNISF